MGQIAIYYSCSGEALPRQSRHVVVCEGDHVELQHLDILLEDVRSRASLLVPQQLVVGLDDVGELVGEIVLVVTQ